MSTSPDYTAWPTVAMVKDAIAGFGVTLRAALDDTQVGIVLRSVIDTVGRETLRQFIPAQEVRYFNGSGTGEMEIDEFLSLTDVSVIGYVGTAGLRLPQIVALKSQGRPTYRIEIARGSLPTMGRVYLDSFPEGRANISVDALWGYASTIPVDLWDAVRLKAASDLASAATLDPETGLRLKSSTLVDERLEFSGDSIVQAIGAHQNFEAALARYKRGSSRRIQRLRPRMI